MGYCKQNHRRDEVPLKWRPSMPGRRDLQLLRQVRKNYHKKQNGERWNRTKLEENLLDDNGMNLGLFTFICLVHKYNVIYTDNYMYYEYIDDFNTEYIMINKRIETKRR